MNSELIITKNALHDIIVWLQLKNIVCIHANKNYKFFYNKAIVSNKNELDNTKLIYIDVSIDPNLLYDDEWTWYIKNNGFVDYKSIEILPNNIYNFVL
jgi:hypothetical protein